MSRQLAKLGDGTTSGGQVISATSGFSDGNASLVMSGDMAWCPKCKDAFPVHGTAVHFISDGKDHVATGDKVLCRCPDNVVIATSTYSVESKSEQSFASPSKMVKATPVSAPEMGRAMKGAVWPPYNPMTGEDLTDKLRAALEANHKKAIILTLADAAATLKDMAEEQVAELKGKAENFSWEKDGTKTLDAANTANDWGGYGATVYQAYDLAKQFGDYGVKAEVFTSKGKEYIAITTKNNSDKVLRHVLVNGVRVKLNGHKYRTNNYKVMQLGLTPQSRMSGYKGAAVVTFIISATINTNELVFNDDYHLVDWFGNVGTEMFQAMASMAAGEVVLLGIGALFGGASVLFGAFIFVAVSIVVGWVFEEWNVSEKVVSELKNAIN